MALEEYRRKRDFGRTPEPAGELAAGRGSGSFVVQKHAARRPHYDLRLELDGVLKSWAVTKAPSLDPADKRLAVQVEDHPLDYADFEGIIPKGEYGGGTVMVWDRGRWAPHGDPREGLARGKLGFTLEGEKLKGGFALVRLKGDGRDWLLIKERDGLIRPGSDIGAEAPDSVLTGRDLDSIALQADRVWRSNRRRPDPSGLAGARRGPPPDRIEPQLATLAADAPSGEQWLHEIKFDGYRALCRLEEGRARMITRRGLDWTDKFAALARAAEALPVTRALLDGEVVVLDSSGASAFEALQQAIGEGRSGAMSYFVFDLLHLDGWDLRGVALEDRKRLLAALVGGEGPIRYSDHVEGRGPETLRKACAFALEGVVSKRRDRPWRAGRGRDWIKSKCLARQEFVIGGFTPPAGSRSGLGAVLAGVWADGRLVYCGRVGSGFSEATLADLRRRLLELRRDSSPFATPVADARAVTWVEPELVAEVEFTQWTRDGLLRHPVFQGLRFDKDAREVVRETVASARPAPDVEAKLEKTRLTHPDRVLWPGQGITKRGLAAYYIEVADWMLPHVVNRPLTLVRCPQGNHQDCFYQRHAMAGLSKAIRTAPERVLYIEDLDGLLALVQIGTLEVHTWGSRVETIEHPDRVVFDLDPDEGLAWDRVVEAAFHVRAVLRGLGLESFVKTTGGKGLHVMAPLEPVHRFDQVKAFTKAVVEGLERDEPARYTANMAKAKRVGRIYVDFLRNQRGATFVAAFSTRARAGAPVSVPLSWDELGSGLRSDHFTVETLPRRIATLDADPWEGFADLRQRLGQGD
ncbi:MAG: DNA ligase D [Alphaproteobacteria bacterium]|nr:DNA ligase D [Alphaproteobacteria bacterium]